MAKQILTQFDLRSQVGHLWKGSQFQFGSTQGCYYFLHQLAREGKGRLQGAHWKPFTALSRAEAGCNRLAAEQQGRAHTHTQHNGNTQTAGTMIWKRGVQGFLLLRYQTFGNILKWRRDVLSSSCERFWWKQTSPIFVYNVLEALSVVLVLRELGETGDLAKAEQRGELWEFANCLRRCELLLARSPHRCGWG